MKKKIDEYFVKNYYEFRKFCFRYGSNSDDILHNAYLVISDNIDKKNIFLKSEIDFKKYFYKVCVIQNKHLKTKSIVIEYEETLNDFYIQDENYIYINAENGTNKEKEIFNDIENNGSNFLEYVINKNKLEKVLKKLSNEERLLYYYFFKMNFNVKNFISYNKKNNLNMCRGLGYSAVCKERKRILNKIKKLIEDDTIKHN